MRAFGLIVVFAAAKAVGVWGHEVPASPWSPIAYFWQDALIVLAFAAVDARLAARPRAAWALYAALALYAAINIPVVRVLSTPLTLSMWRAARGTIADSIRLYATAPNVWLMAAKSARTA